MYRPDQIYNRLKYDQEVERTFPSDDGIEALIMRIWEIDEGSYILNRYIFFDNFRGANVTENCWFYIRDCRERKLYI